MFWVQWRSPLPYINSTFWIEVNAMQCNGVDHATPIHIQHMHIDRRAAHDEWWVWKHARFTEPAAASAIQEYASHSCVAGGGSDECVLALMWPSYDWFRLHFVGRPSQNSLSRPFVYQQCVSDWLTVYVFMCGELVDAFCMIRRIRQSASHDTVEGHIAIGSHASSEVLFEFLTRTQAYSPAHTDTIVAEHVFSGWNATVFYVLVRPIVIVYFEIWNVRARQMDRHGEIVCCSAVRPERW